MDIRTFDSAEAVAAAVARRVAEALVTTPTLWLGLPSGRTPGAAYAELRRLHAAGGADFARATAFALDEFVGISSVHPGSFRTFMERHLFQGVNLPASRVHFLDGAAGDLETECERYETTIDAAGGIDLLLLGIGANGHIGFNEPGDALVARTHRVTLAATTRRDNAALFGGDPRAMPREALSMGMGSILKATSIVLVATGARKARGVERAVHGPLTTRLPASLLQLHRRVELYLDRAAAGRLHTWRVEGPGGFDDTTCA